MDLFPLWNSLRVAAISTVIVFFAGVFAAYYIARLPRLVKGVLDVMLTLPLVLPPTVIGYLLLRCNVIPHDLFVSAFNSLGERTYNAYIYTHFEWQDKIIHGIPY